MQPLFEITVNPLDLSRYGMNPAGKPLYRVVWSDSRRMKVYAQFKMHELPMYEHLQGKWVLERWLPADQVMGMSRETYDVLSKGLNLPEMAYPEDGEYEFVMAFPHEVVPGAAATIIEQLEYQRKNLTLADRKKINAENAVAEEAAKDKERADILGKAMARTEAEVAIIKGEREENQAKFIEAGFNEKEHLHG